MPLAMFLYSRRVNAVKTSDKVYKDCPVFLAVLYYDFANFSQNKKTMSFSRTQFLQSRGNLLEIPLRVVCSVTVAAE